MGHELLWFGIDATKVRSDEVGSILQGVEGIVACPASAWFLLAEVRRKCTMREYDSLNNNSDNGNNNNNNNNHTLNSLNSNRDSNATINDSIN
mmetsp:Transcript_21198/g.59019  ORF Transcript_21198/g.59019 Transcript_21198/m.59019 type:complete len:93 (+) Transcript_21198:357-635(+)